MLGLVQGRYADVEEEEVEFYGQEDGDDDEDYDEEGEGGDDYGDYGDYDEEAEEEVWPREDEGLRVHLDNESFTTQESLRGKYNEVEIDTFMRLLNIKPRTQWQDTSTHHYKLGIHNYEDESQELDIDFHLLSESERKHAERIQTEEWRKGSEVKMVLDGREPLRPKYRF